jgi:hypothetical protein
MFERPKHAMAPRPYDPLYGCVFACADLLIGNCPHCGRRSVRLGEIDGVVGARCVFCEAEGPLPERAVRQARKILADEDADPPWLRDDPNDDEAPRSEFVFLEHQTEKAWLVENVDFAKFWAPKSCSIMERGQIPGQFLLTMPNWLWRMKLHETAGAKRGSIV